MTQYQPIVDASCCPVFLLAILGPRLLVAGAVFANEFIAQELTDYLNLGCHPTDYDKGLRRTAQLLVTLRECIQDLHSFYGDLKFIQRGPIVDPAPARGLRASRSQSTGPVSQFTAETPLGRRVFPHFKKIRIGDTKYSLTYESPLAGEEKATRALFTAYREQLSENLTGAKDLVVVKFTQRYCKEAHELLAGISLAPKLLYYEYVTGIHFVVMEHLVGTEVTDDHLVGENGAKHIESLRRAVKTLHDEKLVFGDLRRPNILITKDGLRLVDFDWSGKQGIVRYPIDISSVIRWPKGVKGEAKIEVEHDRELFSWLARTEL